uniref:Molybdenum cofactor sulfurase n=1 Tax=Xenopus tropicalis TaxID=8364 RepID=A0A6I8R0P4_XENTR
MNVNLSISGMSLDELLSAKHFQTFCRSPSDYGYGNTIEDMRRKEFSRIGGNPHSHCISSRLTYETVEQTRYRILQHFNTSSEDYTVIFTAGSTAAMKLVAEIFPWTPNCLDNTGSRFCYLTDNHTSVIGIRGITKIINVLSVPVEPEDMLQSKNLESDYHHQGEYHKTPHLFCYPAQSNFSGTKYPLAWIEKIRLGKLFPLGTPGCWFVLLDASSYVSTSPLDLSSYQPDFVTISFYKIFGFPTGLGALIVSNRVTHLLRKNYFGGGTSAAYLSGEDFYVPKASTSDRYEDGTISFLDIIAIKYGFDTLERLTGGMEHIQNHTHTLASYTYSVLSALRYANGASVIQIYSDTEFRMLDVQGPVINFNVLDESGGIIGYSQVDKLASLYNIHFRTGCFCNSGACQKHLRNSNMDVKQNLMAGHVCGDNIDVINGQPTGSIRISFGFMSTFEDARVFITFIIECFIKKPTYKLYATESLQRQYQTNRLTESDTSKEVQYLQNNRSHCEDVCLPHNHILNNVSMASNICTCKSREISSLSTNHKAITLAAIYLYPIKSCAPFQVSQWPVTEQGLLFDRNWMIVNENRVCFSQKNEPKLCLIHPSIDLKKNIMIIKAKGMDPIETPLMDDSDAKAPVCQNKVCGDRVHTYDCGEKIADWLSRFLNRKCHLIRQSSNFSRFANANRKGLLGVPHSTLSLVNEAQYLLVNRASIVYLRQQLESSDIEIDQLTQRFRANIVINGSQPFEEENWAEVFIDGLHFQVSGKCNRCQIICIDQHTGEKKKDVFQTLSTCREGKATFGMYLLNSSCSLYPALLKVGSPVIFAASASRQSKNTAK